MKKTLLFLFLLNNLVGFSQAQIPSFYSLDGAQYSELVTLSNTSPIDESPNGPNAVWDFTNMTITGVSVDSNPTPTSTEVSTFPNTNHVSVNTGTFPTYTQVNKVYSKMTSNMVWLTGFVSGGQTLNFSTDNAQIGYFPMTFGDTWTDNNVQGTFISGTYSGTASGTSVTSFDGYGTMTLHIDNAVHTYNNVTRYKSVQNINLNYGVLTNVGTVKRTTICYFDTSNQYPVPVFKSTTTIVNIPMLSVANQTTTQLQNLVAVNLNNAEHVFSNKNVLYPNPAHDVLSIQNNDFSKITNIAITDASGRIVLQSNSVENGINVSSLQNGVYFVTLTSDQGTFTEKLIKN